MTVHLITWTNAHKFGDIWVQHHALRHRVFRRRCDWSVPEYVGLEYDEFDTPKAKYLVSVDENRKVQGAMRLIPTTGPYMSQMHWPEMFSSTPPCAPDVWEATRFCCDHTLPTAQRRACVLELLEACMTYGLDNGIKSYIAVMSTSMFPIGLRRNGCDYRLLGSTLMIDDKKTGAAEVPITNQVLDRVRSKMRATALAPAEVGSLPFLQTTRQKVGASVGAF